MEQRTSTGETTTFEYGADGLLARAVNRDAEVVLGRDALGRTLSERVDDRVTAYAYDPLGRCVRREAPSGLVSLWTYDAAGRPLELCSEAGTLTFTHDAVGHETKRRLGTDVLLSQTWDAAGRLTLQSVTAGSADAQNLLQHRAYAYRRDGYLTEIRELTTGTRRFDLDATGRVTGVRAHGWTETYAYDQVGNLVQASAPDHGLAGEREFDGTLVRRADRNTYQHDAQGRLVRRTRKLLNGQTRTWTYTWTAEDRLVGVCTPDGERWRYAYDPLGRRLRKYRLAEDGTQSDRIDFSWDDTRLAEQTGPDGKVITWDYEPGTHRPIAQTDHQRSAVGRDASFLARLAEESSPDHTAVFQVVVTDAVGMPTELVTAEGETTWQSRTMLWGATLVGPVEPSAANCPLRFPGQYADTETGLHYNYFRYYDPETACYLS
ncbi:RHS repeat-associated core domain-containing protein [Streptomyces misionensis]